MTEVICWQMVDNHHFFEKNGGKIEGIPEYKDSGHGGGDHALMRDFLEAVSWNDISRLTSTVDVSVESHVMAFDAEKSRRNGRKVQVKV